MCTPMPIPPDKLVRVLARTIAAIGDAIRDATTTGDLLLVRNTIGNRVLCWRTI